MKKKIKFIIAIFKMQNGVKTLFTTREICSKKVMSVTNPLLIFMKSIGIITIVAKYLKVVMMWEVLTKIM